MADPDQTSAAGEWESHGGESRLRQVLEAGHFAVTAELNAPASADPKDVYANVAELGDVCDGINATDGSGGKLPHEQRGLLCADGAGGL